MRGRSVITSCVAWDLHFSYLENRGNDGMVFPRARFTNRGLPYLSGKEREKENKKAKHHK